MDNSKRNVHNSGPLGMLMKSGQVKKIEAAEEEIILKQHLEIEQLNTELAPFKIFKSVESDILNDGSLDYDEAILQSFDLINLS